MNATEIDELNSFEVDSGTEDASPCRLNDDPANHLKLTLSSLSASPETPSIPSTPASLVNQSLLSPGLGSPGAQSTSSGSGIGADPVHDLPVELLSAGWRKFWSRREGRPYFYNKNTAESKWEMPSLAGQTDPLVDPLGLHSPVGSPPVMMSSKATRHSSIDAQPNPPLKRSISEDFQVVKKQAFSYSPYWCFTVPSNVVMYERPPSLLFPPHIDIEIMRSNLVSKLRQSYQEMCRTRESIEAPVDSFNRWLLERKVVDQNPIDPLLPSACPTEISPSMHREIMSDIPMRLVKSKYVTDLRRQFVKYAEAAQRMMTGAVQASADSRRLVKWHAEDALTWLRNERNASYEDLLERLTHLRRQCQPHLSDAASTSVDGICSKLYSMACDAAKKIRERHKQILAEFQIKPVEHVSQSHSRHRVMCYPVHLATPAPPPVTVVERKEQTDFVLLTHKNETLRINVPHFHKLEQLYQLNCRDDPRFEHFLARVWCLLKRYQAFFGSGGNEGFSLQGALPLSVFECLHRVFGVTFECFASPLNCYFKQYCSAFADTDGYFGSRGPILEFYPLSGSFEANPPFSEELMEAMVDHFESLLSESQEPLSFTVFIPDFRDPPPEALIRLESSRFNRKQITIAAHEHEYRHGFQHSCPSSEMNMPSAHGTLVVFLQNEAGFQKWEPTTDRLRELLIAYRPAQLARRLSTSR